jgi:hypothetical protein
MEKTFIFGKRNILGEVAHWSVCQSPYHRPENLEIVLDKFNKIIAEVPQYPTMTYREIEEMLQGLKDIPEFMLWNERKNGRQGNGFSGAGHHDDGSVTFYNAKADDDFIDLDALIGNVANSIVREGTEKSIPEILGQGELKQISQPPNP